MLRCSKRQQEVAREQREIKEWPVLTIDELLVTGNTAHKGHWLESVSPNIVNCPYPRINT